jgi:ribosomal protein S12 methylthiotransferase accessory factor
MNKLPCARIRPSPDSRLSAILEERFAPCGLGIHLNDITTDLPIPVVFALLTDARNDGVAIVAGASANLDPEAAAIKALIEAAQGRRWIKLLHRRRLNRPYSDDFSDVVTFEDHVALFGSPRCFSYIDFLVHSPMEVELPKAGDAGAADAVRALEACVSAFSSKGLEIIVVDVTQPDVETLGFHVVKVLVPGLIDINANHNYPLLGGNRLYTVPRALGFIDRDVLESELNPIPHPFP